MNPVGLPITSTCQKSGLQPGRPPSGSESPPTRERKQSFRDSRAWVPAGSSVLPERASISMNPVGLPITSTCQRVAYSLDARRAGAASNHTGAKTRFSRLARLRMPRLDRGAERASISMNPVGLPITSTCRRVSCCLDVRRAGASLHPHGSENKVFATRAPTVPLDCRALSGARQLPLTLASSALLTSNASITASSPVSPRPRASCSASSMRR